MIYFDPELLYDSFDVTLVLGYDASGTDTGTTASVLLCRFHMIKPYYGKGQTVRSLFKDLHDLLDDRKMKLERHREGGSSGRINYSKELRMMLHTPNVA